MPIVSKSGLTNPVAAQVVIKPPSPNATSADTDALELVVPQSAAPNFPNIYALVVLDPDTNQRPFIVDSGGAVQIFAQPFAIPLAVHAATTNPDARVAGFFNGTGDAVLSVQTDGSVDMPLLAVADPHVAGRLWNNAGVVTVSAG